MGKWQERIDTFCLRGWLYMERSDTPDSARKIYWRDLYYQIAGGNNQQIPGDSCNMSIQML